MIRCHQGLAVAGLFLTTLLPLSARAQTAECSDFETGTAIYGSGPGLNFPVVDNLAKGLAQVPEAERITIFYAKDEVLCQGYRALVDPSGLPELAMYSFRDAAGVPHQCVAPAARISFTLLGEAAAAACPDLAPGADVEAFPAFVRAFGFIAGLSSSERSISAAALYNIYGFGAGAEGHAVEPWTEPDHVVALAVGSLHRWVAEAIRVPAAAFHGTIPPQPNITPAGYLALAPHPGATLAYTWLPSSQVVKTLAYQHFGQSCAYLPDSSAERADRLHVRTGQYPLSALATLLTRVDTEHRILEPGVAQLLDWLTGSVDVPEGFRVESLWDSWEDAPSALAAAGVIPLCALWAVHPGHDLSVTQSFAPARPCHGAFESTMTGSTDREACVESSECEGAEGCRFGFCEDY